LPPEIAAAMDDYGGGGSRGARRTVAAGDSRGQSRFGGELWYLPYSSARRGEARRGEASAED
jgi:hypothetical protein